MAKYVVQEQFRLSILLTLGQNKPPCTKRLSGSRKSATRLLNLSCNGQSSPALLPRRSGALRSEGQGSAPALSVAASPPQLLPGFPPQQHGTLDSCGAVGKMRITYRPLAKRGVQHTW
jgi:hypothetical protein